MKNNSINLGSRDEERNKSNREEKKKAIEKKKETLDRYLLVYSIVLIRIMHRKQRENANGYFSRGFFFREEKRKKNREEGYLIFIPFLKTCTSMKTTWN